MTRLWALLFVVAACGDNSDECGPGTVSQDGICVWDGSGSTICGDGTALDPVSNTCIVDPSLCQGGTVLVNGSCQDPNAGITVDLEEGPEPNGIGTGSFPAGQLAPKAIGAGGFVIHGCIQPVNGVADLDAYTLTVTAPTLLDITAVGIGGLDAGFIVHDQDPSNIGWQRYGIDVANTTSQRQAFLPKAGTYDFVVTDSRTFLAVLEGGSMQEIAAGNPDGTSCYYVTLEQETIPAPTVIPVPAGIAQPLDGTKVLFATAALPAGTVNVTATTNLDFNVPAFDVLVNGQWLLTDANGHATFTASTDPTVFALDYVYNFTNGVVPTYTFAFH